jgi:hypothetical protein
MSSHVEYMTACHNYSPMTFWPITGQDPGAHDSYQITSSPQPQGLQGPEDN